MTFFDTIWMKLAMEVLLKVGLPPMFARSIPNSYEESVRWVECRGVVDPHPLQAEPSLLQGCPLSPLLFVAIMTC